MKDIRIKPGSGQESVWDYPRPPRLEIYSGYIEIYFGGVKIADTHNALRVLETSHPPVFYLPTEDIRAFYLIKNPFTSWCEWKGLAQYYDVVVHGKKVVRAAWYYPEPSVRFSAIKNHVAFYPALMDACYVDNELVIPQRGDFYGGWITSKIVGPFKGGPDTECW